MPARPFGRGLADFGALGEAEKKLLESTRRGDLCVNHMRGSGGKT
jgi:hypothetical protein